MSRTLISVIIPTYNRSKYITQAIDSVLTQETNGFEVEIIVVDDGSTDDTQQVIKQYSKRVNYQQLEHWGGPARPRNYGVSIAKGDYVAFLDSDDFWEPDKLQREFDIVTNGDFDVAYTDAFIVDGSGERTGELFLAQAHPKSGEIFVDLLQANYVTLSSALVKKDFVERVGGFTEDHSVGFEDYHFWLKLAAENAKFGYIDAPLFNYRMHGSKYSRVQMAKTSEQQQILSVYRALLKYTGLSSKYKKLVVKRIINLRLNKSADGSRNKLVRLGAKSFRKTAAIAKQIASLPSEAKERKYLDDQLNTISKTSIKPSLLLILPWLSTGGADKVALDICAGLSDAFEISIITTEADQPNNWHTRFAQFSSQIYHLPDLITYRANYPYFIAEFCKQTSVDSVLISNSLGGYQALPKLRKESPNTKVVDLLHGQGGKAEAGGYPALMQPYDKYLDLHITVSEYLKTYLIKEFHTEPQKIIPIHNGVDVHHFNPVSLSQAKAKTKLGLKRDTYTVCWLGRFSGEKRPMLFAKIAAGCQDKNIQFVMGGGGDEFALVQKFVKDNKLANRLVLLGPYEDAKPVLAACDALVMTSEMEGLPIVLLEAGAMGKPVIAPNVGGIPEYITIDNGLMVSPNAQIHDYLAAIGTLKVSKHTIKAIRDNVLTNFSTKVMVQNYEKIL